MGARGKKRVRANGQVASGKLASQPRVQFAPPVKPELMEAGLELFRSTFLAAGEPDPDGQAWQEAYQVAQARIHEQYGNEIGDAVLWRVTFLDALLNWGEFQERHQLSDNRPTGEILRVAGTIATHGAERSFDLALFEEMLTGMDHPE